MWIIGFFFDGFTCLTASACACHQIECESYDRSPVDTHIVRRSCGVIYERLACMDGGVYEWLIIYGICTLD